MKSSKSKHLLFCILLSPSLFSQDLIYTGYINQETYIEFYLNIQSYSQMNQEVIGKLLVNNDLSQPIEVRGNLWKDGRLELTSYDIFGDVIGYFNIFPTGLGTWKDASYSQTLAVQVELQDTD